jgi:hypothetical protein
MKKSIPLKEIVGFLPYGLKVKTSLRTRELVLGQEFIDINNETITVHEVISNSFHKPIVRPLSDLTKEITHNGETFVPKDELRKLSGAIKPSEELKNTFSIQMNKGYVIGFSALCMHVDQLMLFEKLYEWHFDIYDWIKDGLAVSINDL